MLLGVGRPSVAGGRVGVAAVEHDGGGAPAGGGEMGAAHLHGRGGGLVAW